MQGMFGAGLLAVGLFIAVMGGFLLNAQTVTTCSTEWEYVTDISAAFQGEKSDLDVDYDPASNITGWSSAPGYNNGLVSGVDYLPSQPNTYFVVTEAPPAVADTITITASGASAYSVTSTLDGSILTDALATEIWHLQRPGAVIEWTTDRVLEIPLSAIMTAYHSDHYVLINITMNPAYPSWPGVFFKSDMRYHYATANHQGYYSWEGASVTSMDVLPQSATVRINNNTYDLSEITIGLKASETLTLSVQRTVLTPTVYMDPSAGVLSKWDAGEVYWNNGYSNVSVSMAFSRHDMEGNLHEGATWIVPKDMSGAGNAIMKIAVSNGRWSMSLQQIVDDGDGPYYVDVDTVDLGKWEAVRLTFSAGSVTAVPLADFRNFGDYSAVNAPVTKSWNLANGGLIGSIAFPTTHLRMCAIATTVRIADGGLYFQNASLTPSEAFPTVQAVSLRIGSAAHVGTGIVFSGNYSSVLIPVRDNQLEIGGRWLDFADVTFMWVSQSMPPTTIADVTYPAALYQKGQSYAAGAVWAMTPSGAKEIIRSDNWTILLEGVWAPSVLFYTGDNVADERTELYDLSDPAFRWDKATFIVILMAVSVCGAVVGAYFGKMAPLDWVAVGGTIVALWLVL